MMVQKRKILWNISQLVKSEQKQSDSEQAVKPVKCSLLLQAALFAYMVLRVFQSLS